MSEIHGAHGIIFAYSASPNLGELVRDRTGASIPFGGRYRVIDFSLSSMMNAGIYDVGVIMQRDYQSLLDHLGSGKSWDMSRKTGGLRILPPFGLPEYHKGNYTGTIEALNAVYTYIHSIKQENIVLLLGTLCANVDISAALHTHNASGAEITAIVTDRNISNSHYRYVTDDNGFVSRTVYSGEGEGLTALEGYIICKSTLVRMLDSCRKANQYRFHNDALAGFLRDGGRMNVYIHREYCTFIRSVEDYFNASADMLNAENRKELFTSDRPVRTRNVEGVSTYYGEKAYSKNSLVSDNCIIEGTVENCILSSGVRIGKGARLNNCIVMRGTEIGENVELNYVIADKNTTFAPGITLTGSPRLPIVVPKGATI